MNMKQKASKLSLTITDVKSVKSAIHILKEILESHRPMISESGLKLN
jgi:hypothetical protein